MTTCKTFDCNRTRAKDSAWCADCLRDRWLLRQPVWRRRGLAPQETGATMQVAKDLTWATR